MKQDVHGVFKKILSELSHRRSLTEQSVTTRHRGNMTKDEIYRASLNTIVNMHILHTIIHTFPFGLSSAEEII